MMALTIRTNQEQDLLIKDLCDQLKIKTSSKLFFYLLENFNKNINRIDELEENVVLLEHDLHESVKVIRNYQSSFNSLINHSTDDFESDLYKDI